MPECQSHQSVCMLASAQTQCHGSLEDKLGEASWKWKSDSISTQVTTIVMIMCSCVVVGVGVDTTFVYFINHNIQKLVSKILMLVVKDQKSLDAVEGKTHRTNPAESTYF